LTDRVVVRELPDGSSLHGFVDLAWRINSADPAWVPPLRMSVEAALDRRKHPFHRHADVAYFVAERDGRTVGRVAAIVNHLHNRFHSDRTGFFGLFEAENDGATSAALIDAAGEWLGKRGMDRMRGPVNFSTNEEVASPGVLVEGFETSPAIMMSHNPRYYPELMEAAGLSKVKDLYAFWFGDPQLPARLERSLDRILRHADATIRPLDLGRFADEIEVIKKIYNAAWSSNWGFVPMSDAEFDHMAKEFRPVVDPELCLIAESRGEPVGFSLALPDLNQALKHLPDGRLLPFGIFRLLWHKRKIHSMRVITLGFKPGFQHLGLGAALYLRTWQTGLARGYDRGEASWILEDNLSMVRPIEKLGGRIYRTYRLYEKDLHHGA
jgi:GNAT superfamily N-acetyltransferase